MANRAFVGSGPKIGETGKFEGEFKLQKDAPYIKHRLEVWDRLYAKFTEELKKQPRKPIKIEMPDGAIKEGTSFETTPMDIAKGISKGLADSAIAAKLIYKEPIASLKACVAADEEDSDAGEEDADEQVTYWDMTRPLEGSCRLELLKFDDTAGQGVFWHSSAHILGQAMEREFGCHLTIGPALVNGFYYDGYFGEKKLTDADFKVIEKHASDICKEAQTFDRIAITKQEALELFKENPFKVQLITNKVPDGATTSCYRSGPLIDLCRGPHIASTAKAKAFQVTKNAAAYWLGDQNLDQLQRMYAVAFPSEKLLKEWQKFQEEAAKRDHRNVGKQQELFMFHPIYSPGSCFWFPAGVRLNNKLTEVMRNEYRLRGFTEVITPNMYNAALFKISGHYQNYAEDMYALNIEKEEWFLKPMNCPGHFVMFDARVRSYKELPIRYADFGVLHRNEASGALTGLTRVRRFQQDDGHIICRPDQIKAEVLAALDFLKYIYSIFGFQATYALSTRPKKALGTKEIWDHAEAQLRDALNESGLKWSLNPGDGAFYGPKIDIRLTDAMKRKFQCGTIQLDFNNPIRFNLQYRKEGADDVADEASAEFVGKVEKDAKGNIIWREGKLKNGFERPVVIHRAVLGSVERFTAIITEHYAGKWPFWLNPRQVLVVPINGEKFGEYAKYVARQLMLYGFYAETDLSGKTLPKKVREGQLAQWSYIAVVGEKDQNALAVTLRERGAERDMGMMGLGALMQKLKAESTPSSHPFNQFDAFEGRLPEGAPAVAAAPAPVPAPGPAAQTHAPAQKGAPATKAAAPQKANALQLRKQLSKQFADLTVDDCVEDFLESHPYVKGFTPCKADLEMFNQLCESHLPETPNLKRWFEHIESFSKAERESWS